MFLSRVGPWEPLVSLGGPQGVVRQVLEVFGRSLLGGYLLGPGASSGSLGSWQSLGDLGGLCGKRLNFLGSPS